MCNTPWCLCALVPPPYEDNHYREFHTALHATYMKDLKARPSSGLSHDPEVIGRQLFAIARKAAELRYKEENTPKTTAAPTTVGVASAPSSGRSVINWDDFGRFTEKKDATKIKEESAEESEISPKKARNLGPTINGLPDPIIAKAKATPSFWDYIAQAKAELAGSGVTFTENAASAAQTPVAFASAEIIDLDGTDATITEDAPSTPILPLFSPNPSKVIGLLHGPGFDSTKNVPPTAQTTIPSASAETVNLDATGAAVIENPASATQTSKASPSTEIIDLDDYTFGGDDVDFSVVPGASPAQTWGSDMFLGADGSFQAITQIDGGITPPNKLARARGHPKAPVINGSRPMQSVSGSTFPHSSSTNGSHPTQVNGGLTFPAPSSNGSSPETPIKQREYPSPPAFGSPVDNAGQRSTQPRTPSPKVRKHQRVDSLSPPVGPYTSPKPYTSPYGHGRKTSSGSPQQIYNYGPSPMQSGGFISYPSAVYDPALTQGYNPSPLNPNASRGLASPEKYNDFGGLLPGRDIAVLQADQARRSRRASTASGTPQPIDQEQSLFVQDHRQLQVQQTNGTRNPAHHIENQAIVDALGIARDSPHGRAMLENVQNWTGQKVYIDPGKLTEAKGRMQELNNSPAHIESRREVEYFKSLVLAGKVDDANHFLEAIVGKLKGPRAMEIYMEWAKLSEESRARLGDNFMMKPGDIAIIPSLAPCTVDPRDQSPAAEAERQRWFELYKAGGHNLQDAQAVLMRQASLAYQQAVTFNGEGQFQEVVRAPLLPNNLLQGNLELSRKRKSVTSRDSQSPQKRKRQAPSPVAPAVGSDAEMSAQMKVLTSTIHRLVAQVGILQGEVALLKQHLEDSN